MYLDKLAKKELDFQKVILSLKANNSKLYYNRFQKELFIVGKDQEEEMNQNYMLINEKIDQKVLKSQKEYEKMAQAINPYGDGHASDRIANFIANN